MAEAAVTNVPGGGATVAATQATPTQKPDRQHRARTPNHPLYAMLTAVAGLLALVGVFWLTLATVRDGNSLAFFGAAASPIVAIVTAFFGVQASSKSAEDAHATSQRLAEKLPGP